MRGDLSRTTAFLDTLRELAKRRIRKHRGYEPRSLHLGSFVSQDFVPDSVGTSRSFATALGSTLLPQEPAGDFRASGSGVLDFRPEEWHDMTPVLDSAWAWSECMASPFVSMDIGHAPETSGATPVLIEFQCVSFGPSAIENSQDISSDLPEAGTLSRLSPTWWMSLPRPQSSISQSLVVPDTMHLLIVSAFDFNGGDLLWPATWR